MNREMYLYPLIFVIFFVLGCATTAEERYINKLSELERTYLKVTTVKTNANLTIKGGRLGLLPLTSNKPMVGNVVSDTIGNKLLDSNLKVVDRTYLVKIIEEQGISLAGLTERIDYSRIGKLSNVDFILVGTVTMVDRTYELVPLPIHRAHSYTECSGATARIIDVTTGDVLVSAVYDTTRVSLKWQRPTQIGQALATGLKYGLWELSQRKPIR